MLLDLAWLLYGADGALSGAAAATFDIEISAAVDFDVDESESATFAVTAGLLSALPED